MIQREMRHAPHHPTRRIDKDNPALTEQVILEIAMTFNSQHDLFSKAGGNDFGNRARKAVIRALGDDDAAIMPKNQPEREEAACKEKFEIAQKGKRKLRQGVKTSMLRESARAQRIGKADGMQLA